MENTATTTNITATTTTGFPINNRLLLLETVHSLELKVASLLNEAAQLLEAADQAHTFEQKRSTLTESRQYVSKVRSIQEEIHNLIMEIPRGDYPRCNLTLRNHYLAALSSTTTTITTPKQ